MHRKITEFQSDGFLILIRLHENENPENDHNKYQIVLLTVSLTF